MEFRKYVEMLEEKGKLIRVKEEVSRDFEISAILKKTEPRAVLFEKVKGTEFKVIGNLNADKQYFAGYFGIKKEGIIKRMVNAIDNRSKPKFAENGKCQEIIEEDVNLDKIPILKHVEGDGGKFITSGVVIAKDKEYGQNVSFHRCMQLDKKRFAIRISPRHLDEFLKRNNRLDVAMCIGLSPNVMLAGATSVDIGVDELEIANSLMPFNVTKAKTSDLLIPADAELVLEGTIDYCNKVPEGPFVDLTGTMDVVRDMPVFEVKKITHKKNPIYQALLPGSLEHKLLMGMPREPTIFKEVSKVCKCLDVSVTPGGCSWLHAAIKIKKEKEEDGRNAIEAAFKGHKSLKHVFIVDEDIDLLDPFEMEWAMATRFQGDKNMIIKPNEKGSSLDPSADQTTFVTTKVGFDMTRSFSKSKQKYEKAKFPQADYKKFLKE